MNDDTIVLPRHELELDADIATRAQKLREQTVGDIVTLMVALRPTKQRQHDYFVNLLGSAMRSATLLEDVYTPHWRLTMQAYERVLGEISG